MHALTIGPAPWIYFEFPEMLRRSGGMWADAMVRHARTHTRTALGASGAQACPLLHRDWAHPSPICTGTGDGGGGGGFYPFHICIGTGRTLSGWRVESPHGPRVSTQSTPA